MIGLYETIKRTFTTVSSFITCRKRAHHRTLQPRVLSGPAKTASNGEKHTECPETSAIAVAGPAPTPTPITITSTTSATETATEAAASSQEKSPGSSTKALNQVKKGGWKYRREAEFPWRLEQVIQEEENWRGTWVLEVKDMNAMDWAIERVKNEDSKERGYRRRPTRHLPFGLDGSDFFDSLEGGQDDLMVQLGKH